MGAKMKITVYNESNMTESILLSLPYGSMIGTAIVVVLGFAAMYYWFDKDRRSRRVEENVADERLVSILQKTVGELEKKVLSQGEDIRVLTKKVNTLEHDNELLVKVLQGRDDLAKEFYTRASASIDITNQTHKLVTSLAESMQVILKTLEKN